MGAGEIIATVLVSAGGGAAIVAGLSAWLGKVWADRIAESEKHRHTQEIERLKTALDLERARAERNGNAQFGLYERLWNRLQDVKFIADGLWQQATVRGYWEFAESLADARAEIAKGRLVINERDYLRLSELLQAFDKFEVGKKRLIDLRSQTELEEQARMDSMTRLEAQLHHNSARKREYEVLLEEVLVRFRRRLGIDDQTERSTNKDGTT